MPAAGTTALHSTPLSSFISQDLTTRSLRYANEQVGAPPLFQNFPKRIPCSLSLPTQGWCRGNPQLWQHSSCLSKRLFFPFLTLCLISVPCGKPDTPTYNFCLCGNETHFRLRDKVKDSHPRSQLPSSLDVEAQNSHLLNTWFLSCLALEKF